MVSTECESLRTIIQSKNPKSNHPKWRAVCIRLVNTDQIQAEFQKAKYFFPYKTMKRTEVTLNS